MARVKATVVFTADNPQTAMVLLLDSLKGVDLVIDDIDELDPDELLPQQLCVCDGLIPDDDEYQQLTGERLPR